DVLSGRHARGSAPDDSASCPQPRLADAVHLVHHGEPRHDHSFWPALDQVSGGAGEGRSMNKFSDYVPWGVCGLAVIYLGIIIAKAQPSQRKAHPNLDAFGRLPAMYNGRVIPLDSLARTDLMLFSGREWFPDEKGRTQPAIKWLLDVMSVDVSIDLSPTSAAAKHRVFRIKDPDLLKRLGLEPRDGFYAYEEFAAKLTDLAKDEKRGAGMMKDKGMQELAYQFEIYKRLSS